MAERDQGPGSPPGTDDTRVARALRYRLRQEELLSELGASALRGGDCNTLLQETSRIVALGLETRFCKVLEFLPAEDQLLVSAGVGWHDGVVGHAKIDAGLGSPAGYALRTGEAVVSDHLAKEGRFRTPQLLLDHGIEQAINVIIQSGGSAFGVLEADSQRAGEFEREDLAFMQAAANLLGLAIERKRGEAALAASYARTREILESISDAFYAVDHDCRLTYVNRRAEERWGRSREDLLGKVLWEVVPHPVSSEAYKAHLRAARERRMVHIETMCPVVRDWIDLSIYPSASGLSVYFRDIGEQKRAEQALRESEARFRGTFDQAAVGVAHVALDGRWLRVNARICAMLGYSEAELLRMTFQDITHPDDLGADLAKLHTLRTGEAATYKVEKRYIRKDGSLLWGNLTVSLLRDAAGTPQNFISIIQDVSDRKAVEAKLAESEARLRAITDAMPQMVWSTRPDGYPDYYNQRWLTRTGTTAEQAMGDGWESLIHPDDRERTWAQWQHALATGERYQDEYRLRMADGSYCWVLGRALPVRDPATGAITRWFGTCTDIAEVVAAREALARSREELECLFEERTRDLEATQARLAQAQRLEALGQLAGGIAHDFNNVLQAVQGGAGLIERRPSNAESVARLARMILGAAERGTTITRRLLAFSRRGELRAEPVDTGTLLGSLREILAHTIGPAVEVRVEVAADLPPLLADRGQLETVLVNLATNARDAMDGAGTLLLAAEAETLREDDGVGRPVGLKPGSYVRLSVSDTGAGMDAATLARASEPFFTTKPAGQGTGLGLAMARGFAEQSGGGLQIESAPGHGTTVRLWLPVAKEARAALGRAENALTDRGE